MIEGVRREYLIYNSLPKLYFEKSIVVTDLKGVAKVVIQKSFIRSGGKSKRELKYVVCNN